VDIDILFYNDAIIHTPELTVPHPRLPGRRFALCCLADLAPDLLHPERQQTVAQLLAECPDPSAVCKT
jgi:2-amino-4-hydroxy-6-hydroxymethyldihydropteridine diphosphokinase